MRFTYEPLYAAMLLVSSALVTAALTVLLLPALERYALARPSARSSHATPTPQGGGISIVLVVATIMVAGALHDLPGFRQPWLLAALIVMLALAAVGAVDDIRPLPVAPRLALHIAAALALVMTLPAELRLVPGLPAIVERAGLALGLVWFINLTNFMDGLDWMTVVEVVPIAATLALIGLLGAAPEIGLVLPVVLALLGGMIGFAPFNRHVARLFLGDVGSLPIGALLGWMLILLALSGHVVAAIILPLYYLADATITLVRRLMRGENLSDAHRTHFYQLATARGLTVPEVTGRVLALNFILSLLAYFSIAVTQPLFQAATLLVALIATAAVLSSFERGRR